MKRHKNAAKPDPKIALAIYRRAIIGEWSGIAARKRLTSHEYDLTREWFESWIPVEHVIRAMRRCAERAKRSGGALYSLGVIKADMETVRHDAARARVGQQRPADPSDPNDGAWRAKWEEALAELSESHSQFSSPEQGAMYRQLLRQLPQLSEDEVTRRWKEITALR
jgi:hypothetical protein